MKRLVIIASAGLLLLAGCTSRRHKAEAAAEGYLTAIANYRFDEADQYASHRTQEQTLTFYKYLLPHLDTAYIDSATPATVTINDVVFTSDSTAFALFHRENPLGGYDDTLKLKKEERHWVADDVIVVPNILRGEQGPNLKKQYTRRELAKKLKPMPVDSLNLKK